MTDISILRNFYGILKIAAYKLVSLSDFRKVVSQENNNNNNNKL